MMKTVSVRYFAAFRDAAGVSDERVSTPASTLEELFEERLGAHAGLHRAAAAKVAVNDKLVNWSAGFDDGDEVLFFPPVAGG
ncbi:MAG: MoaD/ThiS family protein [Pseudomonadota bacterium]